MLLSIYSPPFNASLIFACQNMGRLLVEHDNQGNTKGWSAAAILSAPHSAVAHLQSQPHFFLTAACKGSRFRVVGAKSLHARAGAMGYKIKYPAKGVLDA